MYFNTKSTTTKKKKKEGKKIHTEDRMVSKKETKTASEEMPDVIPIRKGEKPEGESKPKEEQKPKGKKERFQKKKFANKKKTKGEKKKRVRKHKVIEIDPNNPPPFQLPKKKLSAKRMEKWLKYAPRRPVKVIETPEEREARHVEELNATLFVRNLPLASTEQDVEETFARFGKLRYCKIVVDRESGVSKGTGFVCFAEKKDAQKVLDEGYPSYWENSVGGESCISLQGRQLALSWAVDRASAEKLSSVTSGERRKMEKPHDKRNMALAEVGYLKEEEMKAKGFNKIDITRRLDAQKEKMSRLKNPNLFVSTTRLSLKYLPLDMTEKQLKAIAKKVATAANGKPAIPKQVKIVADKLRLDPETGKPRSKGFGFVEYATPEEARMALDAMNNNSELFGGKTLPLVDYAVENVFAVTKLSKSIQKSKEFAAKRSAEEDGEPRKRDRKRQRENRKKGKAEKREAEEKAKAEAGAEGEKKVGRAPAKKIPKLSAPKWKLNPKLREKKVQEFLEKKAQKKAMRKERMKERKEQMKEIKSKIKSN